jgi:solute carrier family 25 protein 16
MVQKEFRLQVLGLLCSYVRLQGPHLYQVLQTPLLDHLLQCLENDTSTTVISLALTVLIMFMPHLCNSLGSYLPRLFVVYTRVLCWDKFGVVRLGEERSPGMDGYSRTSTPLSVDKHDEAMNDDGWQKLSSSFETASSTTPDVVDYFSFLYGLYPINFLNFIREPYKFLEKFNYKDIDRLDIEEETIRQRTELYRQRHTLHPNFLTLTAETELSDQSRWMRVEPADVTAQCIGLVNNNVCMEESRQRQNATQSGIPEALIPTEDIPIESLLSQDDDRLSNYGEDSADEGLPSSANNGKVMGFFHQRGQLDRNGSQSRDLKAPDSPTIPIAGAGASDEAHLQDMLNLQEQLQASFHELERSGDASPSLRGLSHPSGAPPRYPGSVAPSPRLDAYVQSMSHSNLPRSPALRPAPSDTQGTIAYLQREVMLLKNDLNFERYLKQQHLSHIGHLQRKHIKESTAEAETQNLINTNKTLKAKLEEAKKAYAASRQEALKSKNQAKKWEAELSTKIRTLREEQKAWRQDEEATKRALEAAREEADHLRKLLEDSEAEGLRTHQKLQSLNANIEEVNKLRTFVDHLSNKLTEYEARSQEFEMQRHSEENALQQVERMKLRLAARDQEIQKMRR